MNRKQKIIISVVAILIVTLALVGITYAYFLTQIQGNTNTKSIEVSTANLVVDYGEETNVLKNVSGLTPGNVAVTKVFTATNNGNDTADYVTTLESVTNGLTRQQDLKYTLECTSYLKTGFSLSSSGVATGTVDGTCNGVADIDFPATSSTNIMVGNKIPVNYVHVYKLTVNYLETGIDQSVDMNKTFSAKVNLRDIKEINQYETGVSATDSKSLAYNIINNAIENKNGTIFVSTPTRVVAKEVTGVYYYTDKVDISTSNSSEIGWNQSNYWTYGTGYTIDEDTGKFTLTGVTTCKYDEAGCPEKLVNNYVISKYKDTNSSSTNTQKNTTNLDKIYRVDKTPIDTTNNGSIFYSEINSLIKKNDSELSIAQDDYGTSYYFRGGANTNYLNLGGFCWNIVRIQGDGSIKLILASKNGTCSSTNLVESSSYIGSGDFGYKDDNTIDFSNTANRTTSMKYKLDNWLSSSPIDSSKLKNEGWCLGDTTNKYDKTTGTLLTESNPSSFYFSVGKRLYIDKTASLKCDGETINNKIGALTIDEAAYAGLAVSQMNKAYYLYNNAPQPWWTLSQISNSILTVVGRDGYSNDSTFTPDNSRYIRPSIVLSAGTQITSGNGTLENPYEVL